MRTLLGFLVVLLAAQATATQNPPASVEGIVVRFGSNDPMPMALVELRKLQAGPANPGLPPGLPPGAQIVFPGVAAAASLTSVTDVDGRFQLREVPPGEYRVYATRETGYTPSEYGQRSPAGEGIPLIIESGKSYTGIRLAMAPTGSISGRVRLNNGEPAEYAILALLRPAYRDGMPLWVVAQSTLSDDRGDYRFYSLPPGKYYVGAQLYNSRSTRVPFTTEPTVYPNRFAGQQTISSPLVIDRVLETGETVEEIVRRVYYPGTLEERAAKAIQLRAGEQVQGINFSVAGSNVRGRRIRGTVVDGETGGPATGAIVRLVPRQLLGAGVVVPAATADQNGAFEVKGVLFDAYSLLVNYGRGANAYMVIDAGERDVNALKLVAAQGVDVPWRASFDEGVDDEAISRLRVTLVRNPDVIGPPLRNAVMTAGWTGPPQGAFTPQSQPSPAGGFVLRNVPFGEYRLTIAGIPPGAYLKSIRQGGDDVLSDGIRIFAAPENPIEIVIGSAGGMLEGRALNREKQPEGNVPVVLVPAFDRVRHDLYRKTSTDIQGRFRFAGVAPGQYKVFAWEDVLDGAWHDQDFLRTYETRGVPVNVQTATRGASVEIDVIPWSETQ